MSSSDSLFGVLALLAVLCFAALVGLQVMEWLYYSAEPSIWPSAL